MEVYEVLEESCAGVGEGMQVVEGKKVGFSCDTSRSFQSRL